MHDSDACVLRGSERKCDMAFVRCEDSATRARRRLDLAETDDVSRAGTQHSSFGLLGLLPGRRSTSEGLVGSQQTYTAAVQLPEFALPPVREVVIATRFVPIPVTSAGLVHWADSVLGSEFPTYQDLPAVDMPMEPVAGEGTALAGLAQFGFAFVPHRNRLWFRSADGNRLVQIQPDWFAVNWDSAGSVAEYPRYGAIEELFLSVYDELPAMAAEAGAADGIVPLQCEVTYVNHVGSESGLLDHSQAHEFFRLVNAFPDPLGTSSNAHTEVSFGLPLGSGDQVGRLHVSLTPGLTADGRSPIYTLTMTARGKPRSADRQGMLNFVRLGHEAIVRGFAAMTTEHAHRIWRRHD